MRAAGRQGPGRIPGQLVLPIPPMLQAGQGVRIKDYTAEASWTCLRGSHLPFFDKHTLSPPGGPSPLLELE